jgi:hypothetical protein
MNTSREIASEAIEINPVMEIKYIEEEEEKSNEEGARREQRGGHKKN